jgi:hypothetical protein
LEWVTWKDAVSGSTRSTFDGLAGIGLMTNINLGWVVRETEELIVLAHGIGTSEEIDHFTIAKADIVERRKVITPRKPREPKHGEK